MSPIKHEAAARTADTAQDGAPVARDETPVVHDAAFAELDGTTLYALLRLRVDVFVVEQACPYPELDGRDTEPATRHLWLSRGSEVAAYLRLLADPNGDARIGRVVTAPAARGLGIAAVLVRAAVERSAGHGIVLDAQAHLEAWYARLGFLRDGAGFVEDGIPHVPMRRPPTSSGSPTV